MAKDDFCIDGRINDDVDDVDEVVTMVIRSTGIHKSREIIPGGDGE